MEQTHEGYSAGHPWYYYLGGRRLSLKEIRQSSIDRGYRGYDADTLDMLGNMSEPKRSEQLRAKRAEIVAELKGDVARYRELAKELSARRMCGLDDVLEASCADIHTNISLKHNHIYNDLARLRVVDGCLSQQRDLFER